jgi:hypothetical protein
MKLRKIVTLATAGTATAGLSLLGFGISPASAANGVQPITFEVSSGELALAQTPTAGTLLVQGSAEDMPVTTITDARNNTGRSGAWSVTSTASNLTAGSATILASEITLAQSGSFTAGDGTLDEVPDGLVSASGDTIDSVYTYTPTAELAPQSHPYSGSYTGTVTQTVV